MKITYGILCKGKKSQLYPRYVTALTAPLTLVDIIDNGYPQAAGLVAASSRREARELLQPLLRCDDLPQAGLFDGIEAEGEC